MGTASTGKRNLTKTKQGEIIELRLLVVEDETVVAMDLEDLLGDLGHTVLDVAATVPQAMRLVERLCHVVDAPISHRWESYVRWRTLETGTLVEFEAGPWTMRHTGITPVSRVRKAVGQRL